jgi:hypothetical protein
MPSFVEDGVQGADARREGEHEVEFAVTPEVLR